MSKTVPCLTCGRPIPFYWLPQRCTRCCWIERNLPQYLERAGGRKFVQELLESQSHVRSKMLKKTVNYKVTVATANEQPAIFTFNVLPLTDLIVEALEASKHEILPPPLSKAQEAEIKGYDEALKRFDNLAALVKMATIKIPPVNGRETSGVTVAGVLIGSISIQTREAWTR